MTTKRVKKLKRMVNELNEIEKDNPVMVKALKMLIANQIATRTRKKNGEIQVAKQDME